MYLNVYGINGCNRFFIDWPLVKNVQRTIKARLLFYPLRDGKLDFFS